MKIRISSSPRLFMTKDLTRLNKLLQEETLLI